MALLPFRGRGRSQPRPLVPFHAICILESGTASGAPLRGGGRVAYCEHRPILRRWLLAGAAHKASPNRYWIPNDFRGGEDSARSSGILTSSRLEKSTRPR